MRKAATRTTRARRDTGEPKQRTSGLTQAEETELLRYLSQRAPYLPFTTPAKALLALYRAEASRPPREDNEDRRRAAAVRRAQFDRMNDALFFVLARVPWMLLAGGPRREEAEQLFKLLSDQMAGGSTLRAVQMCLLEVIDDDDESAWAEPEEHARIALEELSYSWWRQGLGYPPWDSPEVAKRAHEAIRDAVVACREARAPYRHGGGGKRKWPLVVRALRACGLLPPGEDDPRTQEARKNERKIADTVRHWWIAWRRKHRFIEVNRDGKAVKPPRTP